MFFNINTAKSITDVEALGSKSQFQVIFSRYASRLYQTAQQYINTQDAEDIVQEIMIETWNKRDSLKGNAEGSLKNYLFIRLKYKIIDFYSKKPEQVLWEEALPELIHLSTNHTYDKTILKELEKIIACTIQEMRPSERDVFQLRWEKQFSVQDTAKSLGISSKSVINRFSSAIKIVRKNVAKYYNEESIIEYQFILWIVLFVQIV